jgi:hypothetical protein
MIFKLLISLFLLSQFPLAALCLKKSVRRDDSQNHARNLILLKIMMLII